MARTKRSGLPVAQEAASDTPDLNLYRRVDGYAAPDPEDRLDAHVLAAAEARGFRLATRCRRCGSWLANRRSVSEHLGPVCRAKLAAEVAE